MTIGVNTPFGTGIPPAYPISINSPLDRAYLRPLQEPLFDAEYIVSGITRIDFYKRPLKETYFYSEREKTISDTNMTKPNQLEYPNEFSILGFNLMLEEGTPESDRRQFYNDGCLCFEFMGRRRYLTLPLIRMPRYDDHVGFQIFLATTNEFNTIRQDDPRPEPDALSEEGQAIQDDHDGHDGSIEDIAELIQLARRERHPQAPMAPPETQRPLPVREIPILQGMGTREYEHWKKAFKQLSISRTPMFKFNLGRSALKIRPGESFALYLEWSRPLELTRMIKAYAFIEGLHWGAL